MSARTRLLTLGAIGTAAAGGWLLARREPDLGDEPDAIADALAGLGGSASPTPGGIAVVMPALDEADNLGPVLDRMPAAVCGRPVVTIVADDGSTDATRAIALKHGAVVASYVRSRGGGAALRMGYQVAERLACQVVVTMDADGQHHPDEMARLVAPVLDGRADMVIGSRVLGSHEPASAARQLDIGVFGEVVSVLARRRITDCASGYRAFSVDALRRLDLYEVQFHTGETVIRAAKVGLRIEEVPITISRRASGESKKPKTLRYGLGFLKAVTRAAAR